MKTPFDNFELDIESNVVHSKVETIVVLFHKTLPITFREISYDCSKLPVSKLINNVYRNVWLTKKHNIAHTIFQEHIIHRLHPKELGKIGYIYTPEWDKEKEAWFVLDENNNKIYE